MILIVTFMLYFFDENRKKKLNKNKRTQVLEK